MITLPENDGLEVSKLASVFSDTTNSYKFYWFLSILDSLQEQGNAKIPLNDLALRMIANVWYPLDYFKLSFGKQDGFKTISTLVTSKISIDNSVNSPSLLKQINAKLSEKDLQVLSLKVRELLRWVPFRFIRPYFTTETRGLPDSQVNSTLIELANRYFKDRPENVIYRFVEDAIELNTVWLEYFQKHQGILRGFIYWHLIKFLQKNNPNVIGLSEKIMKPTQRDLKQANVFWKEYIKETPDLRCIYSQQAITLQNVSLDHFLPWSFVAHDQLWNIIPTPKNINSAKSNTLPSIELYVNEFIQMQYHVFKFHVTKENFKIIEDYNTLFSESTEFLASLSLEDFKENMTKHLLPQMQTARNMGFSYPFVYTSKM